MATKPSYIRRGDGRNLEVGGDLFTFKGTGDNGIDSLFFELLCPPGGGPPPHTDPSEELYYVLEGEFEFEDASPRGGSVRAAPGDSFVIPKRTPHTYRNVGTSNGRMLVFFRDNEHMLPFFEELGKAVADPQNWVSSGPTPLDKAMPAARRHGIEPVFRQNAEADDTRPGEPRSV